jgi:hypothetical protein
MFSGDRGISHQVVLGIGDATGKAFLLSVDARQDKRGGKKFVGAAQGKSLAATISDQG